MAATVLVVDDEPGIVLFVERALRDLGHTVVSAGNGTEGLERSAAMAAIDLLVVDLRMPGMDGVELTRRLRTTHPRLKVLYLTGYSDMLFQSKPQLWEDEAFLDKPCSLAGLTEAVTLLLTGHIDAPKAST
jgi:two-component system cell cycle sensor histidine kinase/response regulator CckA